MKSQFQEFQKEIYSHTNKMSDLELECMIDMICYFNKAINQDLENRKNDFLSEIGMKGIFEKYLYDMANPDKFFTRCTITDRDMYKQLRISLFGAFYNRFKQL